MIMLSRDIFKYSAMKNLDGLASGMIFMQDLQVKSLYLIKDRLQEKVSWIWCSKILGA